jgi:hypothetical protein
MFLFSVRNQQAANKLLAATIANVKSAYPVKIGTSQLNLYTKIESNAQPVFGSRGRLSASKGIYHMCSSLCAAPLRSGRRDNLATIQKGDCTDPARTV